MQNAKILGIHPLSRPWKGYDPFLYVMYHQDTFPKGNAELGPEASLAGRNIGNDFQNIDGWNMYHGDTVPGFPQHPHRGFETVTAVLKGYVDHADSAGATGRYGAGDVQWLTAGSGVTHTEMFPLRDTEKENPLELFQIWLNLPRQNKFVAPHYKMLWAEDIPVIASKDANGNTSTIRLIAGVYKDTKSLESTPNSWARDENHHVSIWHMHMEPNAVIELPKVSATLNRAIYFYAGEDIRIDGTSVNGHHAIRLTGDEVIQIQNGLKESKLLLLEGEPIGEPVLSYGPFVMTTEQEIREAFEDYRKTGFGDWPWGPEDFVHPREKGRFAQYPNGTVEVKD